ncbi:unnamed protein product [Adineta steineri]|uniref:Uncharacterized protein n=1 Tax=Adineta steineri TaxID=433720 RepID=A0A814C308_9BILA|nr:unnamed protein product [Adineta steineri]CAF0935392.1 unnamed protein product [Adineta steineri]CAF0971008.1 unnamed protein product [Adineta steineri]
MTSIRETSVRQHIFSLYNLSANEIYFEDYIVNCQSTLNDDQETKIKGRLKVCSKSLVFVPIDIRSPMIKILYKQITKFEDSKKNELSLTDSTIISSISNTNKKQPNSLILICSSVILMSINGRIEPYTTLYGTHRFYFEFIYTNVEDCLSVVGQLYRATTLPYSEQVMMIESIVQGRLKMLKFDLTQLQDLNETILFEEDAYVIKPLIQNPGRCLLTNQCCYFQALNNINEQKVAKYDLRTLYKIAKRRYKFRYIGCELQFKLINQQPNQKKILYLVFANENICSKFYDTVTAQTSVKIDSTTFENMTLRWQQGTISNYDYLLYLNDRGERSFHDCSQYPVFPWVLRNYTSTNLDLHDPQSFRDLSKPIGAINIERLERLKERYINMSLPSDHQRFLYGSFYSNPGFLVYFLCRIHPQFSLCLNDGRFDHPDRLFHSLIDTWKSVLTSDSDVKELLPEFYMSSEFKDIEDDDGDRQDGEFLMNKFGIDFGIRHDDVPVNDVILPPWAEDPRDFIKKMRLALESDYVSQHLHEWIDLIFGYKQRGEEAHQADNLFHYLTYGVPEKHVSTPIDEYNEQLSFETQILEFGQVPKQLFFKPHPRKLTEQELKEHKHEEKNTSTNMASTVTENITNLTDLQLTDQSIQRLPSFEEHELGQFEFDSVCRLHKTAITRIVPHPSLPLTHLLTIGNDGFLRNYMVNKSKMDTFCFVSSRPLTCLKSIPVHLAIDTNEKCSLAFIGSSDNALYIFNLETGTSILSQVLHDDIITDLYVTNRSIPTLLCTSSNDATVRFWSLENLLFMNEDKYIFQTNYHFSSKIQMQYDISFDSPCTCMYVLEEHSLLSVGCQDGSVYLCHFQTGQILKQLTSSSSSSSSSLPILSLSLRSDGLFLAYLSATTVTLVDIISGTDVFTNTCLSNEQMFKSLFYSSQMLIVGLTNGSCDVWNLKTGEKVHTLSICDKISITTITHNHGMFFFGTDDGSVHSYVFASRLQLSI